MSNVVDFPKPPEDAPDSNCVCVIPTDGKPVKWFKFCCSYSGDDGKQYGFDIWARDYEHALSMMACLRASAAVDGQVFAEIPVQ